MAEHFNIPAEITNNWDLFEMSFMGSPDFFFFCSGVLSICWFPYRFFLSFVVWFIIVQVLILFKMKYIEVIHSPKWDIIIVIFYLFVFFVRLVFPNIIEEQLPLSLISYSIWEIVVIEVIFVSTYKTTTKIDKEYSGKIIFLIIGILGSVLGSVLVLML